MKRCIVIILIAFSTASTLSIGAGINRESIKIEIITSYEINFDVEISNEWLERSIASRYRNPGNLRSVNTGRFRSFSNLSDGYEALLFDIECKQTGRSSYCDSSTTIQDFIFVYAPPIENNSHSYVKYVCETLDVSHNTVIGSLDRADIARAIIQVEDPILYSEMYNIVKTIKTSRKYD